MAKHTPGPWVTHKHFAERHGGRTYLPVMRPGNDPVPIAVVYRDTDGYGREEGEANTHLVIAAPDLLAALQAVAPYFYGEHAHDHPHCVQLRAAIAKAAP